MDSSNKDSQDLLPYLGLDDGLQEGTDQLRDNDDEDHWFHCLMKVTPVT